MLKDGKQALKGICHFFTETGTEGGFWAFQDNNYINGDNWSYNGLHILDNGDKLTIFCPNSPNKVIWSGTINLKQYPIFTETALDFWIHADQIGIERDTWLMYFFNNYPAELIPK